MPRTLAHRAVDKARRDGFAALVSRSGEFAYRTAHWHTRSKRIVTTLTDSSDEHVSRVGRALEMTRERGPPESDPYPLREAEAIRDRIDADTRVVDLLDEQRRVPDLAKSSRRSLFLLYSLARQFRPQQVLELGTSVGMSAMYVSAALGHNGDGGHLTTLEGADDAADIAEENFNAFGATNLNLVRGRFRDSLPGVLEASDEFNMAFIDGHHDEEATIEYFNMIFPTLSEDAVVVFDDIHWSDGMDRAWTRLRHDGRLDVVADASGFGVGLAGGHRGWEKSRHILV